MALFSKKKADDSAVKTSKAKATKVASAKDDAKATKASSKKEEGLAITKAEVSLGIPGVGGVKFTLKPRVTEKSTMLSENSVYIFDVPTNATKGAIRDAVHAIWKVNPVKIAIIRNMGKVKIARGKKGRTNQSKKAYVYLKKGEKIEIV